MPKRGRKPCGMANSIRSEDKQSGFFDITQDVTCKDRSHNFPTHISIPAGKGYRHVCPSCGNVIIVTNPGGVLAPPPVIPFTTVPEYIPLSPTNPFPYFPPPHRPMFGGTEFLD